MFEKREKWVRAYNGSVFDAEVRQGVGGGDVNGGESEKGRVRGPPRL